MSQYVWYSLFISSYSIFEFCNNTKNWPRSEQDRLELDTSNKISLFLSFFTARGASKRGSDVGQNNIFSINFLATGPHWPDEKIFPFSDCLISDIYSIIMYFGSKSYGIMSEQTYTDSGLHVMPSIQARTLIWRDLYVCFLLLSSFSWSWVQICDNKSRFQAFAFLRNPIYLALLGC